MLHRTKSGAVMPISEMSDSHLINTIKMLQRKADEGIVVSRGGGSTPDDFWYEEDHLSGERAERHMGLEYYLAELESRGLSMNPRQPIVMQAKPQS